MKEPPRILMIWGLEEETKQSASYYHNEENTERAVAQAGEKFELSKRQLTLSL